MMWPAPSGVGRWARSITYYRAYYEDSYLMPLIIGSLHEDTSDMYDWMSHNTPGGAEGIGLEELLQKMREHFSGTLTVREQRNQVENLWQGPREEAADFLI